MLWYEGLSFSGDYGRINGELELGDDCIVPTHICPQISKHAIRPNISLEQCYLRLVQENDCVGKCKIADELIERRKK